MLKDGSEVFRVRWLEGGGRDDPAQTESFDNVKNAKTFKALVDAHGQHWPPNWVEALEFPAGIPVMRTLRTILDEGGRPVEVSIMVKGGHLYGMRYRQTQSVQTS